MSLVTRATELGSDAVRLAGRGARRARREAEIKRLDSQISKEQREIGRLLYPLLAEGALAVDSPGVHVAVDRIRELSAQREAKQQPADE